MIDFPWVRATASGVWGAIDIVDGSGFKVGEKVLVMALQPGRWCIDSRPIDVIPGLCVSAKNRDDVQYFLDQRRASMVTVEPDMAVMFETEADAMHFVRAGLGDRMSRREVEQLLAAHEAQQAGGAEPDDGDGEVEPAAAPRRGRPPGKKGKKA